MSSSQELSKVLTSLHGALNLLSAMTSKFEQREAHMRAAFDQRMLVLQREVTQMHRRINDIVADATSQLTREASSALMPVAARYDLEVSTSTAKLNSINKAVWMWLAAATSILLLVLLVGWMLVGHYRTELNAAKEEIARYEDAIPVVRAYNASDAVLCDGRLCINVDLEKPRMGDKRQYRPAKPRPQ